MKKIVLWLIALVISFGFINSPEPASGTDDQIATLESEITELESQISEIESTLNSKQTELRELKGEDETEGFTIETNNAIYVFSNARMVDGKLLIDLDYTNRSGENLEVLFDMTWDLYFEQEDDAMVYDLTVNSYDTPEVDGRIVLDYDTTIKDGATVKLVFSLDEFKEGLPLFVRNDEYSSPDGQETRIELPLAEE